MKNANTFWKLLCLFLLVSFLTLSLTMPVSADKTGWFDPMFIFSDMGDIWVKKPTIVYHFGSSKFRTTHANDRVEKYSDLHPDLYITGKVDEILRAQTKKLKGMGFVFQEKADPSEKPPFKNKKR